MTRGLRRELGLVPLAAIVFFNVSGGPYGIEDMVPSFGPGLTLLLLVLVPVLWSLPVALAMSELASAMPDEGGYVTWTTRAFGSFWGFQVGWWSWLDSFIDVAVYPALFVEYARFWHPSMTPLQRWLLAVVFIALLTTLNVIGVRPVGRAAVALAVAALVPVAMMAGAGLLGAGQAPWRPFLAEGGTLGAGLGLGLAVVMWNYSGWDTPSTWVLPTVTLALGPMGIIARFTRASMLEVIRSDFTLTARSKGLSEMPVIFKHALKNALIPIVTLLGPMFAAVGTGSFFVESIFRVPGMGRFFVLSMTGRDYPMIMAVVLTYGAFLAVMNLVVDVLYGVLDPRIRY